MRAMAKPEAVRPSAEIGDHEPLMTKKSSTPRNPYWITAVSAGSETVVNPSAAAPR